MNFNSQVCTDKNQSERLLALGLKNETADMYWWNGQSWVYDSPFSADDEIPAWSLHRLMSMLTAKRKCLLIRVEADLYDVLIDRIEHAIKEGYFNKEYLENGK
jgi:hypothetical protein